jgi:hypothetical protein
MSATGARQALKGAKLLVAMISGLVFFVRISSEGNLLAFNTRFVAQAQLNAPAFEQLSFFYLESSADPCHARRKSVKSAELRNCFPCAGIIKQRCKITKGLCRY